MTEATLGSLVDVEATHPFSDVCSSEANFVDCTGRKVVRQKGKILEPLKGYSSYGLPVPRDYGSTGLPLSCMCISKQISFLFILSTIPELFCTFVRQNFKQTKNKPAARAA